MTLPLPAPYLFSVVPYYTSAHILLLMDTIELSQNAKDWLEAIQYSPADWADGMLESMLDHDCIAEDEKRYILRCYQSLSD
jgi:hypothetical protein